jgi:hypothetical protein
LAVRGRFYLCPEPVLLDNPLRESSNKIKGFFIDIHQRDRIVSEFGISQDISDEMSGKDMTACADQHNL